MTILACIASLRAKGELREEQANYLEQLHGRMKERLSKQVGEDAAEAMAGTDAIEAAAAALQKKKQRAVLQISRQMGALNDMARYRGREGKWEFGKAAEALLVRDERAPYFNVEYWARTIRDRALGRMADLVEHHRSNIIEGFLGNLHDQAGLEDLLREAFGEKSGNESAKAFSDSWGAVSEDLRVRANAAGADIAKLEKWGLPQAHDAGKVWEAGYDAWRGAELPRLDRSRMIDFDTGKPLDDAGLEEVMRHGYDSITTNGLAHREEGQGSAPSIAARMSSGRVFIYRDADAWLASQAQFGGTATVYDAMMGHIHSMSRDIALMERLGPNPSASLKWLKDVVQKRAAVELGAASPVAERAYRSSNRLQEYYDTLTHANSRPESKRLAMWGETLRTAQTGSKLGSAALSTTGDVATSMLTRSFNDLPVAEVPIGYAKYLNPLAHEDRMQAQRMGFVAEQSGSMLAGTGRFMAEEMVGTLTKRLAETTMRLSALNAITEAGRWTHGMGTLSHMTRERDKGFGELDAGFRGMFERYGMGPQDWDAIRETPIVRENGGDWIKPERMKDQRLADNVMRMIFQEMDVAVPTSGVATRAMLDRIAPKGTWKGETIRTAFQFKAFPVTLMMIQWQRAMARETNFDKLVAFGMFFGASALAGAFALQMKEVSKGRNPRPMGNSSFFLEAVAQGGGAGIYGDFVRSTESRFNSGPWQVLAGPAVQTVTNAGKLTVGNAIRAMKGEDTHLQSDLFTLAKSETPVVGSLWWTRLAYERAALDLWRHAGNPMAAQQDRATERRYAKDYGQDYWWAPGQKLPSSAPQLGEAFGSGPLPQPPKRSKGW